MMLIYQLVDSGTIWNPYGVKRFAPQGDGKPIVMFIDGPCCLIKF